MADASIKIRGGAGNAVQIQSRNIDAAAPSDTEVLAWNATDAEWEPTSAGGGATSEWTDTGTVLHPTDSSGTVDSVIVGGDNTSNADIELGVDGSANFNKQAADVDFTVSAVGVPAALFVQGSDGSLGLANTAPNSILSLGGTPTITTDTTDGSDSKSLTIAGGGAASITRGAYLQVHGNEALLANKGTITLVAGKGDAASNIGDIRFFTGTSSTERLKITDAGGVGVGVDPATAAEKFVVDGALALKEQSSSASSTAAYAKIYTEEYGNDANTKLLLHMDGADDGDVFTDSSASGHTVADSGAVTKTAIKKFGTASGFFDGSNDFLEIDTSTDFDFGSGDFCIEAWVYMSAGPSTTGEIWNKSASDVSDAAGALHLNVNESAGDKLNFNFYHLTGGLTFQCTDPDALTTGMWHHVAGVRYGNTVTLYKNGIAVASQAYDQTIPVMTGHARISQRSYTTGYGYWDGYIDELAVTKGEAKYTENFTPAKSAFPITNIVVVDDNGGEYKLGRNW